jgi:segregation and condensation protein A
VDYRVELDVYNGPLDLLLYLIKRDELDIYDIPIARITDSYMEYLKVLRGLHAEQGMDINVAGDFLVMAATLMEIKSQMLLPAPPPELANNSQDNPLGDPRFELVQKLLEYKKFKDAANSLEQRAQEHHQRFVRIPARLQGESDEPPPVDLEEVQVWDLLAAFSRLMKEIGGHRPRIHEVTDDDTPLDLHAADIEDRLHREKHVTLRQLVEGRKTISEMIGVFLALLELIRQKKILVNQTEINDDVEITQAPLEHRQSFIETPAAPPIAIVAPLAPPPTESGPSTATTPDPEHV